MKRKMLLALAAAFMMLSQASAQTDLRILNHLSIGAEVGTMGWGVDISMPITPFVDVQAGFSMMPKIGFNTSVGTNRAFPGLDYKIPVKGQTLMKNGKLLVNVMPVPFLTSFHITAGMYIGPEDIMGMYNTESLVAISEYNAMFPDNKVGLALGDYLLEPDAEGYINGKLKVNLVKPYVGIGIGRGVPKKRIGFKFDIGCVIWGKPTVYCNDIKVLDTDIDGSGAKAMRIITKFKAYPVLNFRLCGKIF